MSGVLSVNIFLKMQEYKHTYLQKRKVKVDVGNFERVIEKNVKCRQLVLGVRVCCICVFQEKFHSVINLSMLIARLHI